MQGGFLFFIAFHFLPFSVLPKTFRKPFKHHLKTSIGSAVVHPAAKTEIV